MFTGETVTQLREEILNVFAEEENAIPLLLLSTCIITIGLTTAAYYLIRKATTTSNAKRPPLYRGKGTGILPFGIGGFLDFAKSPLDAVRRGREAHGDCFTINMLGKRMTFLVGPEAHEVFFRASDDELSQEEVYKFMIPVFGKGVVYDAPPHIRRQQFRFLGTGLRGRRLKSYVPMLVEETREYLKRAMPGDSGEIDILEKMSELTILTASRCLMGREVREKLFEEVADLFHTLDKGITPLSVFWPNAPVPSHWRRDRARKDMVRLLGGVIRRKREAIAKDPEGDHGDDMLAYLVKATYKDGRRLTEHEIVGFFIAMLFAGQHTSSITTTWTALNIARNPDVMRRVLEEQREALLEEEEKTEMKNDSAERSFETLDYARVNAMELAGQCIKESIRMFPPLILLLRHVRKARTFKGSTIPKNDIVVTAPGAAMKASDVFERPDTFDPDRWSKSRRPKGKRPAFDFIGFGGGMHACAGTQFAYLQIRVILTVLFQTYKITPVSKDLPTPDYTAMVVGPIKGPGTRLRYERRRRGVETDAGKRAVSTKSDERDTSEKKYDDTVRLGETKRKETTTGHDLPTFTAAQVRKHDRAGDAWIVVEGYVYDVTAYLDTHPGGESAILKRAGQDATEGFNGMQHPPHARTTLEQFRIGRLG